MGNRPSRADVPGHSRSFFLVMGDPPIRYVGDPSRAPPLFAIDASQADDDDDGIDRAETVALRAAVLSRQTFRLSPRAGGRRSAWTLSFAVRRAFGAQCALRVFVGVDVSCAAGDGVRLAQSARSQTPFCLDTTGGDGRVEAAPIFPPQLRAAVFRTDAASGARRLVYAPIAIVLTQRGAPNAARLVQYTFLDLPENAWERTDAAPRPVDGKVVRQLLQRGEEVYELDDVFDVGAWEAQSDAEESDEAEGNLCVVCLTNRKDSTLLPCRHLCLCYECASMLRFQRSNRCPICRTTIERIMTA